MTSAWPILRVLSQQSCYHTAAFLAANSPLILERLLLAGNPEAMASLGLGAAAFALVGAFGTNLVAMGGLVAARRLGSDGPEGARTVGGQLLSLAVLGGLLGLFLAIGGTVFAVTFDGTWRHAGFFFAMQSLALGPLLWSAGACAYFGGLLCGRLVALINAVLFATQVGLTVLFVFWMEWSILGVGLARGIAALCCAFFALLVCRHHLGPLRPLLRPNWVLVRLLLREGAWLGAQQTAVNLMVFLLYRSVSSTGQIELAALTLTHSGIYPLLFAPAYGLSQAIAAGSAQAFGRDDERLAARTTWLGMGLAIPFTLGLPLALSCLGHGPWVSRAWTGPDDPNLMGMTQQALLWIALFSIPDVAINLCSAHLRAANQVRFLFNVTAVFAGGLAGLLFLAPSPRSLAEPFLLFIGTQAGWAASLAWRCTRRR